VKAAGGDWDDQSNPWYAPGNGEPAAFRVGWTGPAARKGTFIGVDASYGAAAQVRCAQCRTDTEVICLYGERGTDEEGGQVFFGLTRASACVVRYTPGRATESAQRNEFWSMSRDCSGCITCGNH
jgi:hypothetical protein